MTDEIYMSHAYAAWLAAHQCGHELTAIADAALEGPDVPMECADSESYGNGYGNGYGYGGGCGDGDGEGDGYGDGNGGTI